MTKPTANFQDTAPRLCPDCNGATVLRDFNRSRTCYNCRGRGSFEAPIYRALVGAITGRKGLTSRRPQERRAYYLWRMARFHGGQDVTMPVMAGVELGRDPFTPELDALADAVALRVYGTNMAAAFRWIGGMRGLPTPAGQPATAYTGGPICLDDLLGE